MTRAAGGPRGAMAAGVLAWLLSAVVQGQAQTPNEAATPVPLERPTGNAAAADGNDAAADPANAAVPSADEASGSEPDADVEGATADAIDGAAALSPDGQEPPAIADVPLPVRRPAGPGWSQATGTVPGKPADAEAQPGRSPEQLQAVKVDVTSEEAVRAAAAVADAKSCEAELAARGVAFVVTDSISAGDCGVLRPVTVERLSSGVTVEPDTQMLCRAALALDVWVGEGVQPAAKAELAGATLKTIRHASTYVCRSRAGGGRISEHARGNAFDVAAFTFTDRADLPVKAQARNSPEARFQRAVRDAACGPFTTVLGPGTDAYHATHLHLDLAARRPGSSYCR